MWTHLGDALLRLVVVLLILGVLEGDLLSGAHGPRRGRHHFVALAVLVEHVLREDVRLLLPEVRLRGQLDVSHLVLAQLARRDFVLVCVPGHARQAALEIDGRRLGRLLARGARRPGLLLQHERAGDEK
jgi:hypothetical protein